MNKHGYLIKNITLNSHSIILDTVATFFTKTSRTIKYTFYSFVLSKPRAKGVVQINVSNINKYLFNKNKDTKVYTLVEQEDFKIKQPKFLDKDDLKVITPFKNEVNSVVIDTTNTNFSFRNEHILDPSLNVIYEPDIEFNDLPIAYKFFLSKLKKLEGTVAYLSNTSPHNYGHWLLYTLPMLRVYWKYINKQEIDYYYIGDCSIDNFKLETLNVLGIDKKQIVNYSCKADRAITCVIDRKKQNSGFKYPDIFAYRFTRSLFLPKETNFKNKYPKRLYVKRGEVTHRKLINEYDVENFLEGLGFEALTMQGKTIKEQADIYYNADVIISVCGSALTNLLFIKENTKVIEIFPFGYLDGFFFALASYAKANYYYIIGDEISYSYTRPILADVKVNIEKLKRICELAKLAV